MRKYIIGLIVALSLSVTPVFAAPVTESLQLKPIASDTAYDITGTKIQRSWPWYLTRASGIIAAVSLVILILSGIGSVTGHTFRFLEPLTAWATHRALGIALVVSIVVHMGALLFDKFVSFSIVDILVPWSSNEQPVTLFGVELGSFYIALGILAFYLACVVTVSSLLIIDKKPHAWKWLHLLSYATIALVSVHAIGAGTDTGHGIGLVIWVAANIALIVALIARIKRVGTK